MSSLGVKGCTKVWQSHQRNQQFGDNKSIDNGKSQRLRHKVNARINKVTTIRPDVAKLVEQLRNSRYFESPETNLHIPAHTCRIDYPDTWSSKQVHWLSNRQITNHSTTCYRCKDMVEFDVRVSWMSLPNTSDQPRLAKESLIWW